MKNWFQKKKLGRFREMLLYMMTVIVRSKKVLVLKQAKDNLKVTMY